MERETKRKRRSRERDHEKKKNDQNNSFKNAKKLEFRLRHHLDLDDMDDRSKDKNDVVDDNNLHPYMSSWSSSTSSSSSSSLSVVKVDHVDSVFDFPWLKDEDAMFKADDIAQYTTSLEELVQQQMLAPAAFNSYLFHDQHFRLGNHEDYCVDDDDHHHKFKRNDHEEKLDRMEYCIWSSVLDQPLDTGIFNKLL